MAGRRVPNPPCGVMGDGDVCGRPRYHDGPHIGQWNGIEWEADQSSRSVRGRQERSERGSLAEQERQSRAASARAPHVKPPPAEQPQLAPHWFFRDRKRARDIDTPPRKRPTP